MNFYILGVHSASCERRNLIRFDQVALHLLQKHLLLSFAIMPKMYTHENFTTPPREPDKLFLFCCCRFKFVPVIIFQTFSCFQTPAATASSLWCQRFYNCFSLVFQRQTTILLHARVDWSRSVGISELDRISICYK